VAETFCQQEIIKTAYWDRLLGLGVSSEQKVTLSIYIDEFIDGKCEVFGAYTGASMDFQERLIK
jgi:hypothetical protein